MNTITLIGRVGKTPEIKTFTNGKQASFTLATSTHWRDKNGEKQERTEWHNIVINGKLTDVVEMFVEKGDNICIVGEVRYEKWKDASGADKYATKIYCERIELLGDVKKREETKKEEIKIVHTNRAEIEQNREVQETNLQDQGGDDLPFN